MALKADHKYNGKVGPGSRLYETQTGTVGFQVQLDCEDGPTTFTIWLTDKNKARAEKYFTVLGVDVSKLKDSTYLEYGLPQEIEGRDVSFGTKEETYNGKVSVKVAWIGKKSEGNVSKAAARFFGGSPAETRDDDVPF